MTPPPLAISVRQPWAWAIVHAEKDVENRSRAALRNIIVRLPIGDRLSIHAAKTMTRPEYEDAADFMARIGIQCPPPHELLRGGIIGHVHVDDTVYPNNGCTSPWYMNGCGILMSDPRPCDFIPVTGELGIFAWDPIRDGAPDPAKAWMLPKPAPAPTTGKLL